jgi:hypothetical protein
MISFKSGKRLSFVLGSVGILLHAHSALALGDAQMQARNLLTGTIAGRSEAVQAAAGTSSDAHAFNIEPQEQARQLVLGKPSGARVAGRVVGSDSETKSVRGVRRAAVDPQEAARRMLADGV